MTSQMKTTAILKANPGKAAELESLLRHLASQSRLEQGNLRWDLWQSQADPEAFVIDELYRDIDGLHAHRASSHFKDYASKVGNLASRTAVSSRPLDVV